MQRSLSNIEMIPIKHLNQGLRVNIDLGCHENAEPKDKFIFSLSEEKHKGKRMKAPLLEYAIPSGPHVREKGC